MLKLQYPDSAWSKTSMNSVSFKINLHFIHFNSLQKFEKSVSYVGDSYFRLWPGSARIGIRGWVVVSSEVWSQGSHQIRPVLFVLPSRGSASHFFSPLCAPPRSDHLSLHAYSPSCLRNRKCLLFLFLETLLLLAGPFSLENLSCLGQWHWRL